jgi:hypothetical protein
MGRPIDEWHYVISALKDTTQLTLPHRSGLGESEIGNEARTTSSTALP